MEAPLLFSNDNIELNINMQIETAESKWIFIDR